MKPRMNGFQMVASPSMHSVCFCLTDAMFASREESKQPTMTNQDMEPALTASSVPCTLWLSSSLERRSPGVWLYTDTAHIYSWMCLQNAYKHKSEQLFFHLTKSLSWLQENYSFSKKIGRSQSVVKYLHALQAAWHLNTQTNSLKSFFYLLSSENSVNALILLMIREFPKQFQVFPNRSLCYGML